MTFIARYAEKIAKLVDHIYNIGVDVCKLSENEFNVINHGDCWVNNMMFKYNDDGKPIDHIFVSIMYHKRSRISSKHKNSLIIYYSLYSDLEDLIY